MTTLNSHWLMDTAPLASLISKHPDLPIVFLVDSDVVQDDGGYWFANRYDCHLGEVLDCDTEMDNEHSFTDRDEFREAVEMSVCKASEKYLSEKEIKSRTKAIMDRYEPYWKKAILLYVMA